MSQRESTFQRVAPFTNLYNHLRGAALRRNIGFTLTFEEFVSFTDKKWCFYCDTHLVWRDRVRQGQSLGGYNLDRKDSEGIYEKSNLVACCGTCNKIKSDRLTFEQMLSLSPALKTLSREIRRLQEN